MQKLLVLPLIYYDNNQQSSTVLMMVVNDGGVDLVNDCVVDGERR